MTIEGVAGKSSLNLGRAITTKTKRTFSALSIEESPLLGLKRGGVAVLGQGAWCGQLRTLPLLLLTPPTNKNKERSDKLWNCGFHYIQYNTVGSIDSCP